MEFLFTVIIVFILLGYLFKLFFRYALPWIMGRYMKKQQEKFYQGFNQQGGANTYTKEGDVKIRQNQKKKHKDDDDFGEYVDFEDVDN